MRASRRTGGGVLGSRSMPLSAPCRASTRPHFSSRQTWVIEAVMPLSPSAGRGPESLSLLGRGLRRGRMRRSASYPPAAVDGDEAAEDRFRLHIAEAGCLDHPREGGHVGETLDRFDQIAIAVLVL